MTSFNPTFEIEEDVFSSNSRFIVFGKPKAYEGRRMGVLLVSDEDSQKALQKAKNLITKIKIV